jgi:hypothetical protein
MSDIILTLAPVLFVVVALWLFSTKPIRRWIYGKQEDTE